MPDYRVITPAVCAVASFADDLRPPDDSSIVARANVHAALCNKPLRKMIDSQFACDWARARPSRPTAQVAACAGWQRQDRERRDVKCAGRVIQVCGDWESII